MDLTFIINSLIHDQHMYVSLPETILQKLRKYAEATAENNFHVVVMIAERNKSIHYCKYSSTPRSVKHGCKFYWGHNKNLLTKWPAFGQKFTKLQKLQQREIKAHKLSMTEFIALTIDLRYEA